ncbi:MAG: GlsB/YeaQ/YmgE family stress response membrane protein [Vicinamibacterales bacterium]
MGLIASLIVGGIIGWLASIVMKTNAQMGMIANVVVGVVGSWLGGMIANALGLAAVGSLGSFVASLVGAVVLIWLLRALGLFKG